EGEAPRPRPRGQALRFHRRPAPRAVRAPRAGLRRPPGAAGRRRGRLPPHGPPDQPEPFPPAEARGPRRLPPGELPLLGQRDPHGPPPDLREASRSGGTRAVRVRRIPGVVQGRRGHAAGDEAAPTGARLPRGPRRLPPEGGPTPRGA